MAINTKAIKTRIVTVKNTKKITKAMQMISAVKMRKAIEAAVNTRMYAQLAKELMNDLGKSLGEQHPLAEIREVKNVLLIIITSNRGLCGSYNSNVLKKAQLIINENPDKKYSVVALGKKAGTFAKRNELDLKSMYEKISENPDFADILPISNSAMSEFKEKTFDEVQVIYTDFVSGLIQTVRSLKLLPMSGETLDKMIQRTGANDSVEESELEDDGYIEFEPNKGELLDFLIPMLVEVQLFQAMLESAASEHSARMLAMKNATESAGEMIEDLTLEFNKGRQAAITQEIAEIVSGANALEL